MANIIIFHSVLGLRKGVLHFADFLRTHGHTVHTPDLYFGEVFDDMEQALAKFHKIGIPEMMSRTAASVRELPAESFYAGFSNGGASALLLAGTQPTAKGCLLFHAALLPGELGIEKWPGNVAVQVHYAANDPWKEPSHIEALGANIRQSGAGFQYFEYPVDGHLFTDEDLPEYNREATDLLWQRALTFINRAL